MLTAVVGVNWGDEGKGRMVDLLSRDYDVVARYQGGNNAGHTVVNARGKFILNLLPSGILREGTVNVMGQGMVIDIEHLAMEINNLKRAGISVKPDNLKISERAVICLPYHKRLDGAEEDRLAGKMFGSTRRGIAPVYADKHMKRVLRMSDIAQADTLEQKLTDILEWKNLTISGGYGLEPESVNKTLEWLRVYGEPLCEYVCDVTGYLGDMAARDKRILFEAQLGALRDIDFGIYPYTSSSSSIAAYAPIGAGVPWLKLDNVVGIMKAYSSCVGEGPFTCELFGDEGERLRRAGNEYGAATGRPRRVGGFDAVASRRGVKLQGADEIALTKLDVLSYMQKIPVCTHYDVDGHITGDFPLGDALNRAKPVYEYVNGWNEDISAARKLSDLPANARKYIEYIESLTGARAKYISVGAEREQFILA